MRLTDADFDAVTRGGALCDGEGRLDPPRFEAVMREQLQRHTQARRAASPRRRAAAFASRERHGSSPPPASNPH